MISLKYWEKIVDENRSMYCPVEKEENINFTYLARKSGIFVLIARKEVSHIIAVTVSFNPTCPNFGHYYFRKLRYKQSINK